MRTIFLALLGIFSLFFTHVSAIMAPIPTTYPTREAFEASGEWGTCKIVTDGCSEFSITEDGKVGDAIKACKVGADFPFAWSCKEYRDDILFLGGAGDEKRWLSELEYNEYLNIQGKLSQTTVDRVEMFLEKYGKILETRLPERQQIIHGEIIAHTTTQIHAMEAKFRTEEGMTDAFRMRYRLWVYVRFSLMRRGFERR